MKTQKRREAYSKSTAAKKQHLIPTELINKRSVFSKTFTVEAGKYRSYMSAIPIHQQDSASGAWKEISASFVPLKEAEDRLVSRTGNLTATCGISSENPFITLQDREGHSLSWGYEGVNPVKPEVPER